jgi:hypothetical protein
MHTALSGMILLTLAVATDWLALPPVPDTLVGHGLLVGAQWYLSCACSPALPSRAFDAPASLRALPFLVTTTVLCGFAGVSLDGDHFLAARPMFSYRAALSLPARPPGHSAAFLAAAVLLACAAVGRGLAPAWAPLLVGVAVGSHQARDATKRGVLLWPGHGGTPRLPLTVFYAAMAASPLLISRALGALTARGGGGAPAQPDAAVAAV